MLNLIKEGDKIELILNVFLFSNFKMWDQAMIKELIEWSSNFVNPKNDNNLIYYSHNSILTICLICVHLTHISEAV